jgi:hypothetical protein
MNIHELNAEAQQAAADAISSLTTQISRANSDQKHCSGTIRSISVKVNLKDNRVVDAYAHANVTLHFSGGVVTDFGQAIIERQAVEKARKNGHIVNENPLLR